MKVTIEGAAKVTIEHDGQTTVIAPRAPWQKPAEDLTSEHMENVEEFTRRVVPTEGAPRDRPQSKPEASKQTHPNPEKKTSALAQDLPRHQSGPPSATQFAAEGDTPPSSSRTLHDLSHQKGEPDQ